MPLNPNELISWFKERPYWMQDAVCRLASKGKLTDVDRADLAKLAREEISNPDKVAALPPLVASSFAQAASGARLRLDGISEVKGIDALNPRIPLAFKDAPLAIVYGGTGVGKSGYIRILNNVCGSKNSRKLLCNVFEGKAAQSCKIGYTIDGTSKEIEWQPSTGVHPELSAIQIYDTESGQVYVNDENEVTYEPWLLRLLQRLVDCCADVDRTLATQIAVLPSKKPTIPTEFGATSSATWFQQLSPRATAAEIAQRCEWLPAHKEELELLQGRIAAKNPADEARQLRTRKSPLERLRGELATIGASLTSAVVSAIDAARTDAFSKRKAASEDAKKVFEQAPLEGVGLESWKLLWEQARAYSERIAYPDQTFPQTKTDARCVLCQQPLDDAAKQRLISFEGFVKGELEKVATVAEDQVQILVQKLPKIPAADDFEARLATMGLEDTIVQNLLTFRSDASARLEALRTPQPGGQIPPEPAPAVLVELAAVIDGFEVKAKLLDEDAKKVDKTDLKKKVSELDARKWLSEQKPSVEEEVARLKSIAALESARKLTNTAALSRKKADLAQELVTDAFIKRFTSELKALSAARIRVAIVQTRTGKGHVFHQIRLKEAKLNEPVSNVLSEGERRVVSLAAFLADIEGVEAETSIVFDDPITSLDQDFEESVVARIVALAKKRQVIVFTHRLSMLTLLEDGAKAAGLESQTVALNRVGLETGHPGETPFFTRKPDKVINGLKDRLAKARKILNESGKAEYDIQAKAMCSDIRILVERLVEDTLLNDVVRRFRRAVQTQGKIKGLARIRPEDCHLIDEFMTKYSRFEHSQPNEAPVPLPEPDELDADLGTLQTWVKEFSERKVPAPAAGT